MFNVQHHITCHTSGFLWSYSNRQYHAVELITPLYIMQEVGIHVMAPIAELAKDPLPHSVAIQPLREMATASQNGGHSLPEGAGRFVVTVDGTESEEQIQALKGSGAAMVLLQIAEGVSRVHASRRVFELLRRHDIDISVIHFRR